jgi:hypothetical protein
MLENPKFKMKLEVATEGNTRYILAIALLIAAIAFVAYILLPH